jgi:hypothetical protein
LRESVKALTATTPADAFVELKRLQDELQQEILPLQDKIKAELTPKPSGGGSAPQGNARELEQGIALLQGWAKAAGEHMSSAARHLDGRRAAQAAADQQSATDELEKIWDAVIPFHPLLARDLADQTTIAQALGPDSSAESKPGPDAPSREADTQGDEAKAATKAPPPGSGHAALETESEKLAPVVELQERTVRRTQLLKLKAEAELARPETPPPPAAGPNQGGAATAPPIDPEQLKAGFQKAIELAPRAVEQMERVVKSLKQKDPQSAYPPAEDARKILEEIEKAQPRKEPEKDQNKQNEDQKKQDQKDQQKKDQQKQDQPKDEREKKDQKKEQEQKKQEDDNKSAEQKKDQKQPQPQVSYDRIEEALRKVRERQQEKHERDRQMKARVFGKVPVEKDW